MTAFGSYDVIEEVAVGSTGTVYRARHREIARVAAIKELGPEVRAVPGLLERFRSEAHTLAQLDSPHVVSIYDFVEEPERVWIAEEWVDGVTIETLLRGPNRFTPEQALGVLRGALQGLAHAHDRDIVHRDIAPSNILADLAGTSMLVDFGLAAPVGQTGRCGTPAYMSPEAVAGSAVGKPGDVYSAAAVLYTLLGGRVPFPGRTAEDVFDAHLHQSPPELSGHGPAMASLLQDAMAKDPSARPPDAGAFLARFEDSARQRYGAGWPERSSIVGLVGAAATGVAATSSGASGGTALLGASAAAGAGSTGSTAFVAAAVSTGTAVSRFAGRKGLLIGGGAALAVGIATAAAIAVAGTSGGPSEESKTTAAVAAPGGPSTAPLTSTAPSIAPSTAQSTPGLTLAEKLAATVPNGRYTLKVVVTASTVASQPVGTRNTVVWSIKLSCATAPCAGTIKSSSGRVFTATYDGKTLTAKNLDHQSGPCAYLSGPQKGQLVPGTHYAVTVTNKYVLKAVGPVSGGSTAPKPPAALVGTGSAVVPKAKVTGNCTPQPPGTETLHTTLKRNAHR